MLNQVLIGNSIIKIEDVVWAQGPTEQGGVLTSENSVQAGYTLSAEIVLDTLWANGTAIMLSGPTLSHSVKSEHAEVCGRRMTIQCDRLKTV